MTNENINYVLVIKFENLSITNFFNYCFDRKSNEYSIEN